MSESTVVRSLPDSEWGSFIEKHPNGNIFHTPEMFEVFSKTQGYRPSLWAVIDHNRCPLALLLPVEIFLSNGFLRYFTTRTVVYGSVLWSPSEEGGKALGLLLQSYIRDGGGASLFTELRNISNLEAVQPVLHENSFVYEDHLNYLIDLGRSPEAIFQNIGPRTRKNIRRALTRGDVVIEEVTRREQIREWYGLLQLTYKTAKVPLADCSLFETAFDILLPKGMIRYTLARVGKAVAAISAELLYKDVIYGWYGGTDRAYSNYVPNDLLTWHILEWGAQNGYRMYDFGGAGKPDQEYKVRDFKAKFGGSLVCFGRNSYVHRPFLTRIAKQWYPLVRRWL